MTEEEARQLRSATVMAAATTERALTRLIEAEKVIEMIEHLFRGEVIDGAELKELIGAYRASGPS